MCACYRGFSFVSLKIPYTRYIWWFGGFSQIKITSNTVVLSQVLINSNDERAYLPNLMSAKCTTYTV